MSPSEQARNAQLDAGAYPSIDNWTDSNLHKGNVLYIWEADGQKQHGTGDAFAMTPNTAFACEGDPNKLQGLLQTNLDERYPNHRPVLQAYEINGDIPAAFSRVEANTCHGPGGGEQYFIPNFDQQLAEGRISKVDDLNLYFNKESLPIDPERISLDKENTKNQIPMRSPEPSPGTSATLEGAYIGQTPQKAAELNPKVNETQNEWNKIGGNMRSQSDSGPVTLSDIPQTANPKQEGNPMSVGAKKEDIQTIASPQVSEQSPAGLQDYSQTIPAENSTVFRNLSGYRDTNMNPENEAVSAATKTAGGMHNG